MIDWFGNPIVPKPKPANPCISKYGPGPEDKTCNECANLVGHRRTKVYWKCKLRPFTSGPGSDHKRAWPACAKFEQWKRGQDQ
jgi:hypothetical protein